MKTMNFKPILQLILQSITVSFEEISVVGAGEMAHLLRALATLPGDPNLVPSTQFGQFITTCNSSSRASPPAHTHVHIDNNSKSLYIMAGWCGIYCNSHFSLPRGRIVDMSYYAQVHRCLKISFCFRTTGFNNTNPICNCTCWNK